MLGGKDIIAGAFGFGTYLYIGANVIIILGVVVTEIISTAFFRPSIANSYMWTLYAFVAGTIALALGIRNQPKPAPQNALFENIPVLIPVVEKIWSPTLWAMIAFALSIGFSLKKGNFTMPSLSIHL